MPRTKAQAKRQPYEGLRATLEKERAASIAEAAAAANLPMPAITSLPPVTVLSPTFDDAAVTASVAAATAAADIVQPPNTSAPPLTPITSPPPADTPSLSKSKKCRTTRKAKPPVAHRDKRKAPFSPPVRRSCRLQSRSTTIEGRDPVQVTISEDDESIPHMEDDTDSVESPPANLSTGSSGKQTEVSAPQSSREARPTAPSPLPPTQSPTPGDSSRTYHSRKFYSEMSVVNWGFVTQRLFLSERNIDVDSHEKYGVIEMLRGCGLLGSVSKASKYYPEVVKEFYANLTPEMTHASSPCIAKFMSLAKCLISHQS